jgi:hypothetical protein
LTGIEKVGVSSRGRGEKVVFVMGCCLTVCGRRPFDGPAQPKFGTINIRENSDSDSDPGLKAKGASQKQDRAPLLQGPNFLTRNLALSSSSSIDSELKHVGELLAAPEDDEAKSDGKAEGNDEGDNDGRTFKDVPADLNIHSSHSGEEDVA